jgi:hypothetical protein
VTGDLRLGHREPHVREQPARAALPDVALRVLVRLGGSGTDDVEPKLLPQPHQLGGRHAGDCAYDPRP